MTFKANIRVTLCVVLIDLFFHSTRPTWRYGTSIAHFVLLAFHGVVVILGMAMVYVHVSRTIWFDGGLFGEMYSVVRGATLTWFFHLGLVFLNWAYREFITKGSAWEDPLYWTLFSLEQLFAVMYWAGVFYVVCRVSDRYLYPPYHRMRWSHRQQQILPQRIQSGP